jgi:hypothetical protein
VQAEKTEITERVSKIVFMDTRLSEAVASWQANLLIDADAHRDDEKRFVVHADEKLTAFVEIEWAIRACGGYCLTSWRNFLQTARL